MGKPFLITGLPRSRTAWFSVAMRGPHSTCVHEPTAYSQSLDELITVWDRPGWDHMGVSDSALGFHLGSILEAVQPRTLLIQRPVSEVVSSFRQLLGYSVAGWHHNLCQLDRSLKIHAGHPLVHTIQYADLKDHAKLAEAIEWLVPGHSVLALEIEHMNIQASLGRSVEIARAPHSLWHLAS